MASKGVLSITFPRVTADAAISTMTALGLDGAAIAAEAVLPQKEARIPASVWGKIWTEADKQSRDPLLPTRVGLAVPFGALGLLDYLTSSAATIDASMAALATHMAASASLVGVVWSAPRLSVVSRSTAGHSTDEFVAALVVARLRQLAPREPITRILLNRTKPRGDGHERLFQAPVVYRAARAGIELDLDVLDMPMPTSEPGLHASLRSAAIALGAGGTVGSLENRIVAVLPGLVARSQASAATIAQALGMSRRTLYRKLGSEGLSVAEIINTFKLQEVRRLMRTDATLADISALAGYADQAAFTRAFKRWFGVTPGQWRKHRSGR